MQTAGGCVGEGAGGGKHGESSQVEMEAAERSAGGGVPVSPVVLVEGRGKKGERGEASLAGTEAAERGAGMGQRVEGM